jgi:hypothetical protein
VKEPIPAISWALLSWRAIRSDAGVGPGVGWGVWSAGVRRAAAYGVKRCSQPVIRPSSRTGL